MKMMTKGLLAATALVSLPSLAHATVVISNVSINVPNNIDGVYVNVVTGTTGFTPVSGYDFNVYGTSSAGLNFLAPASGKIVTTTSTGSVVADLAAGTVINASSFLKSGVLAGDLFRTGGAHIFGFSFLNESTGIVNYGYARITTTTGTGGGAGFPATITQLVYENSGAALTVPGGVTSGVPEPTTWAMMMLGFGAMGAAMRRQKVAARIRLA